MLALLALLALLPRFALAPPQPRQQQITDPKLSPGAMPRADPGLLEAALKRKAANDDNEASQLLAGTASSPPVPSPPLPVLPNRPGASTTPASTPPKDSAASHGSPGTLAASGKKRTSAASSKGGAPGDGGKKSASAVSGKGTKKTAAVKLGPQQAAAFPELYVPDLEGPLVDSLATLVAERFMARHAEPRLFLVEFYAPWCPHCQRFAPDMERLGAAVNGRPDAEPPAAPVSALVARVDCVADRTLCESYDVKGFPTILAASSVDGFKLKNGKAGTQTHLEMLHIPSAESRKIDTIARAMSSYLGNLSSSAPSAVDGTPDGMPSVLGSITLPSQDEFNAELTRTLHAQAALESTLAPQERSDNRDSWLASQRNTADIEMSLVMSAQIVLSRQLAATQTDKTTDVRKLSLQQAATKAGRLFRLVGPAYNGQPWAAAFDQHVLDPQRLSKMTPRNEATPNLNEWFGRWGAFGRPLSDFKREWESCIGMFSFQRGYPCALWQLLHTATVGMSDENAAIEMANLVTFIAEFFECKDCRDHFIEIAKSIQVKTDAANDTRTKETPLTILTSRKAAVLWLWRAHNAVTAHIMKQESEEGANPFKSDQLHMKQIFPSETACPACRRPRVGGESPGEFGAQDFEWVEDKVFEFLVDFYSPLSDFGNWKWSPPSSSPSAPTNPTKTIEGNIASGKGTEGSMQKEPAPSPTVASVQLPPRRPAEEKAKEQVAAKKAAARAQAQIRRERVEQAKQQASAAKAKVDQFESFRARAIRLKKEEEESEAARQREASELITGAAAAGLRDERAQDPALLDETIVAVGQRARAAVAARNSQQQRDTSGKATVLAEQQGADGAAKYSSDIGERGNRRPHQGDVVVASYDYEQSSNTDISMREGENFVIEQWDADAETSDWALVRRLRTPTSGSNAPSRALTGYVPYAYLEKASAPALPQPPPQAVQQAPHSEGEWHFPWRSRSPPPPPQEEPVTERRSARAHVGRKSSSEAPGGDDIFAQFDKDHDGTLTKDEFRKARSLFKNREV